MTVLCYENAVGAVWLFFIWPQCYGCCCISAV